MRRGSGPRGCLERSLRGGAPARSWRARAVYGARSLRPAPVALVRVVPCRCRVGHRSAPTRSRCRRQLDGRRLAARRRARGRAWQRRARPARLRCFPCRGLSRGRCAASRRRFFLRFLGRRPPYDQQLADVLDRCGAELRANALEHRIAIRAHVAEHADLDELVRDQVDVDLMQHRRREPVLADADDGMQVMRLCAKRTALGR